MSDKDLGEMTENFEAEIENLKNKEFRLFGIKVTAVTIGAAMTLISTGIGGLYGAFVVYQDYMDMKEQIQNYVAPDLSGFQEQLSVLEQKVQAAEDSVFESQGYIRDVRTALAEDIRTTEGLVGDLEDRMRELETDVRDQLRLNDQDVQAQLSSQDDRFDRLTNRMMSDFDAKRDSLTSESDRKIQELEDRLEQRIQRALDNPLAN
jgi:DNA anti-recombination protein RmuC